jgi:hypothetical protein
MKEVDTQAGGKFRLPQPVFAERPTVKGWFWLMRQLKELRVRQWKRSGRWSASTRSCSAGNYATREEALGNLLDLLFRNPMLYRK